VGIQSLAGAAGAGAVGSRRLDPRRGLDGAPMSLDAAVDSREFERTIADFFTDRITRAEQLGGQYAQLWRFAFEATSGGKRIRPRLLLLAHDHLGGRDLPSALRAGAAF